MEDKHTLSGSRDLGISGLMIGILTGPAFLVFLSQGITEFNLLAILFPFILPGLVTFGGLYLFSATIRRKVAITKTSIRFRTILSDMTGEWNELTYLQIIFELPRFTTYSWLFGTRGNVVVEAKMHSKKTKYKIYAIRPERVSEFLVHLSLFYEKAPSKQELSTKIYHKKIWTWNSNVSLKDQERELGSTLDG